MAAPIAAHEMTAPTPVLEPLSVDPFLSLETFLAATVCSIVEAQTALDDAGSQSLERWETDGLPPTVLTWSHLRLHVTVGYRIRPKEESSRGTDIQIAPCAASAGSVTVGFRYCCTPQEQLENA
jgi:hypothetical protein